MPCSLPTANVVPIDSLLPLSPRHWRRAEGDVDPVAPRHPASAATVVARAPALLRHARRLMPNGNDAQNLMAKRERGASPS